MPALPVPAVQRVEPLLPPALPLLPPAVGARPGLRDLAGVARPVVGGVVAGPENKSRVGGRETMEVHYVMFSRYQAVQQKPSVMTRYSWSSQVTDINNCRVECRRDHAAVRPAVRPAVARAVPRAELGRGGAPVPPRDSDRVEGGAGADTRGRRPGASPSTAR